MSVNVLAPILRQVRLELREGHLDRVQVWTVWWQEQEPASGFAHGFGGSGILVCGEVVQNDDGAWLQFRKQDLRDVGRKGFAVHPRPGSACLHA